jgi:hypothetical protein
MADRETSIPFRTQTSRTERLAVLAACTAASLAAVWWSWRNHAMLNYGDALAHLHIARRVFDSHQPRISQLGSVWLPLPHLLMLPFVQVYAWWANGAAALVPSMLAYIASCVGIYRLARRWLQPASSALALAFFALNPNLLYLQTTAMTEPLFVCEMIWVALWMVEWRASLDETSVVSSPVISKNGSSCAPRFLRRGLDAGRQSTAQRNRTSQLEVCVAIALIAAIFTRYDGWIMAMLAWTGIGLTLLRRRRLNSVAFWVASAFIVAAPIAWFAYNQICFGDWLEFMRGPYSAKAIEIRTAVPGDGPPHPGWHNPWVALLFFVKAAEMDAVVAAHGNLLLVVSLLGTVWAWLTARKRAFLWALLLWLPLPFYAYSIAYSSVPIFLPPWWPHSWYNTRYGMELLPALALGLGFTAHCLIAPFRAFKPRWSRYVVGILFAVLIFNAGQMVREHPLTFTEGVKNLDSRRALEAQIPPVLKAELAKRPGGVILMETSVFPSLVAQTGIPFRQTINEADLQIFRDALAAPAAHAALVLAFDGDSVDQAVKMNPAGLIVLDRFHAHGQPSATLYASVPVSAGKVE